MLAKYIIVTSNEHDSLNHWQPNYLFNSLFRPATMIKHWVDSMHQRPVMQKTFPCHDVYMIGEFKAHFRLWCFHSELLPSSLWSYIIYRTPQIWPSIDYWSLQEDYGLETISLTIFLTQFICDGKNHYTNFPAFRSLQHFAHAMTSVLSWHVQNFVVITDLQSW